MLIEVCFVDSEADVDLYHENYDQICEAIATVIGGEAIEQPEPIEPPVAGEMPVVMVTIRAPAGVEVRVDMIEEDD